MDRNDRAQPNEDENAKAEFAAFFAAAAKDTKEQSAFGEHAPAAMRQSVNACYFMTRIILLLLLLTSASVSTHAQSLWQKTAHGMSIEEVQAAVPSASRPTAPDRFPDGMVERLRLEEYSIANEPFRVGFIFKNDKLEQVMLTGKKERAFRLYLIAFESLSEILRSKYGPEISKKRTTDVLQLARSTWKSERTNISLVLVGIDGPASLTLTYQVRMAAEADKL